MNSVVNPVSSYGFGTSQASTLGSLGRGYSGGGNMGQRPSFAIQELLGLSGSQYGATQAAAAQGFTPSQFFSAAAAGNDPSGAGVSGGVSSYPYHHHHAHHHSQNFASANTASMPTSMQNDVHDFSGMSSMYSPTWRSHPGFLSQFGRDDSAQGRVHQHPGLGIDPSIMQEKQQLSQHSGRL